MKPIVNMLKNGADYEPKRINELMNQHFLLTDEETETKLSKGSKLDVP